MPKSKWYAVAKGRTPGIYQTWDECKAQTAGFSGAIFKSFKTRDDAQAFITSNSTPASAAAAAPSRNNNTAGKKRAHDDIKDVTHISQKKRSNYHPFKRDDQFFCIDIHFDGGSRGNPGVAGAGAEVIAVNNTARRPKTTKYLIREFCGNKETNNYAEYTGLIAGLKQAKKVIHETFGEVLIPSMKSPLNRPVIKLQVYGDSNLVIQQLKGNWKVKNESLKPLYHQCQRLIVDIKNNVADGSEVSFDHVYRDQNKVADELANEAMDQRRSWTTMTTDADKADNNVMTAQMGMGFCKVQYNT